MTQPEPEIVKINSEGAAWEILEKSLQENYSGENLQIVFEDWPTIHIKIKSEKHDCSLTAQNMEGLLELQKTINRSFALLIYNSPNAVNLKISERKALELVFKVSPGSSEIQANLQDQAGEIIKAMVNKMEAKHLVICAVSAGLLWAGTTCWSNYLQQQKDIKQIEMEKETRRFASDLDVKRMELIADATKIAPAIEGLREDTQHLYNQVLKSLANTESASIAGVNDIPGETIRALIQTEPTKSEEIRLDGEYRILKVDSSLTKAFKVHVRNTKTDESFVAVLQDEVVLTKKHKSYLQDAEWGKKPVLLKINARKLRGAITGATIVEVEKTELPPIMVATTETPLLPPK